MIDQVYRVVQALVNKENNGYLTPTELNLLAKQAQERILSNYFSDYNFAKNKGNRGAINSGYANLDLVIKQKLSRFVSSADMVVNLNGEVPLPRDLRFIEDDGVTSLFDLPGTMIEDVVVSEVDNSKIGRMLKSDAAPSTVFPVYTLGEGILKVYPPTIPQVRVRYLRKPKDPNWTYRVILGKEVFDMSNGSYQDFELHESEFANIVISMLSQIGIVIRENNVVEIAENLKDKQKIKDNE